MLLGESYAHCARVIHLVAVLPFLWSKMPDVLKDSSKISSKEFPVSLTAKDHLRLTRNKPSLYRGVACNPGARLRAEAGFHARFPCRQLFVAITLRVASRHVVCTAMALALWASAPVLASPTPGAAKARGMTQVWCLEGHPEGFSFLCH